MNETLTNPQVTHPVEGTRQRGRIIAPSARRLAAETVARDALAVAWALDKHLEG